MDRVECVDSETDDLQSLIQEALNCHRHFSYTHRYSLLPLRSHLEQAIATHVRHGELPERIDFYESREVIPPVVWAYAFTKCASRMYTFEGGEAFTPSAFDSILTINQFLHDILAAKKEGYIATMIDDKVLYCGKINCDSYTNLSCSMKGDALRKEQLFQDIQREDEHEYELCVPVRSLSILDQPKLTRFLPIDASIFQDYALAPQLEFSAKRKVFTSGIQWTLSHQLIDSVMLNGHCPQYSVSIGSKLVAEEVLLRLPDIANARAFVRFKQEYAA